MHKIFYLFIACLITAFSAEKPGKIYELKAGKISMKVSAMGGRIISYTYEKKEILTQSAEHENFGSTLWIAPQSDWGWPPFAVLDNMEYCVEQKGNVLKMTSNPDPKSGFQFVKKWTIAGDHSIQIEYIIVNIAEIPKSVGAWEVTRVPCGGTVFFPNSNGLGKVPESNLKIDLQRKGINWVSIDKNPIAEHKKLFSTAQEGWLGYALSGMLFIRQFPDTKPENYSPQQGEVEIYIDKDKNYTELENQGAYQLLKPGESLNYKVTWFIAKIPETIKVDIGNQRLCKLVSHHIKHLNHK